MIDILKSGIPHGPFSYCKLISQNKTIPIIQTEAVIDKNFEAFLPKFLIIPVRRFTFSKAVKVKNNVKIFTYSKLRYLQAFLQINCLANKM